MSSFLDYLTLEHGWLLTNIPQVLHGEEMLESRYQGLSELDILDLKMNVSGISLSYEKVLDGMDDYGYGSEEITCLSIILERLNYILTLTETGIKALPKHY